MKQLQYIWKNTILKICNSRSAAFAIIMLVICRYRLAFFVPTVWAQAARIATPSLSFYWMPSLSYMLGFLLLVTGIMAALILYKVKHVEFNWENDDV